MVEQLRLENASPEQWNTKRDSESQFASALPKKAGDRGSIVKTITDTHSSSAVCGII
jgi:hypothetical protein